MLRHFNLSMVFALDGAHVRYVGCCVCSWGAKCTDLVGWPIRGGQAWLKNLSISEGMLRRFNWSMVFGTCFGPRSYVVCSVCSWGVECTDLVGWPIHGRQAWLKNLSISKGMLRCFNWSMVFDTCFWSCL